MTQIRNQGFPYQQPNLGQLGANRPILQNSNNQHPYYTSHNAPIQAPPGLNNYNDALNQYQKPNSLPSEFFQQNFINPNRFQNYNPQENTPNYGNF